MSLIEEGMTACAIMNKVRTPDGEGGFITEWTVGAEFQAAITFDSSLQAKVAEKQGVKSLYTVTTAKNAKLDFHDVIKRLSDPHEYDAGNGNTAVDLAEQHLGQHFARAEIAFEAKACGGAEYAALAAAHL